MTDLFRGSAIPAGLAFLFSIISTTQSAAQIAFDKSDDGMTITVDGQPFAVYVWNDSKTTRPYFKQLHAPGGSIQITRNHPPADGDLDDHATYHPGLWWGFGDVGGNDYWRMKARIEGGDFIAQPEGGADRGHFAVRNRLFTNDGSKVFCEQICRYTLLKRRYGTLVICDSTFRREDGDFWLGDQEEMGVAVRVASQLATQSEQGGRILNSDGKTDLKDIRTKQSDWCDYSGPIAGRYAGILMMDDPANFRRPWWHAVDTGLLIANPLGESELNGNGKRRENVLVRKGEDFQLRYGVLIHVNDSKEEFNPTAAYKDFLSVLPTVEPKRTARTEPHAVPVSQLPEVPDGFEVSVFAQEPMVYKPTAICFDARGRLFVGQGPQYPRNFEDSPTDSVFMLLDTDGDGTADESREFAGGFNSIQGLAWKGNDLYVANAPELTVVRDVDGDDVADEYVMVYTDLGNREHALHGLNWGPDGKLYMSKGNSKGHNQPEKYGYVAPRAFRELWDVEHPPGAPDDYPPETFSRYDYRKTYHHWDDDWGREGGILRCDPLGANLEIVSRGMRNPWDIAMDAEFNWLGTDNDQSQGDRIIMPFVGAHFGWGHRYSSHWSGEGNLPTVPVSGPMFSGSGAGIVYYAHDHFPPEYRGVFFINDWLNGTFVYRPAWDGALMQPAGGTWEQFAKRGGGETLYRPTDLEFGPNGRLFSCGWGGGYDYNRSDEGSWIFRISYAASNVPARNEPAEQSQSVRQRSVAQLITELGADTLPARRVIAQDELVRRGHAVRDDLIEAVESGRLRRGQQTWAMWAFGRMAADPTIDEWLVRTADATGRQPLDLRIQAIRILAFRKRAAVIGVDLTPVVRAAMSDPEPRLRFAAVQAVHQAGTAESIAPLMERLSQEDDRIVFYAGWQALRNLVSVNELRQLLKDRRPRVRLAALLSLQEDHHLTFDEVLALAESTTDPQVRSWALTYALNPQPPRKMPNTQSRIEFERSVPADKLIERANKAGRPEIRRLYLQMISRASLGRGDWKRVREFYETLHNDDERALVLPALTISGNVRSVLWEALASRSSLRQAAIDGLVRLDAYAVESLSADERKLKREADDGAGSLATWLLTELTSDPDAEQTAAALETVSRLSIPPGWTLPDGSDTVLGQALHSVPQSRRAVLELLEKIDPEELAGATAVRRSLRELCESADPLLYYSLAELTHRLGLDVELTKPEAATPSDVLTALADADPHRGRELFFANSGGTGCAACHRVSGRGNEFAPDLSSVGLRLRAEKIVESILQPSQAITEGYSLHSLELDDGRVISGVILRETASQVTVFRTDRVQQTIDSTTIEARHKLKKSAMPDGYELLGNRQVADLTAFLLTLRHATAK